MVEFIEDGHIYLVDGVIVPSVTQILHKVFPEKYEGIPKEVLNAKAVYGTDVHKYIEIRNLKDLYHISMNIVIPICFKKKV